MNKSIIFPYGSGGNQVRWLLFLDQQMTVPSGKPWDDCQQNVKSKFNFIQKNVYPVTRSWNNWLQFEWAYRTDLDAQISVNHDMWKWEQECDDRELYLTFDNICTPFNHYFHINLGLNCLTPDEYKLKLSIWFKEFNFLKNRIQEFEYKKILSMDVMYDNPELDYDFYKEIIDFFGFDNNYNSAKVVHNLYHQCRMRSANDFYNYFTGDEFYAYLDFMKNFKNQTHD